MHGIAIHGELDAIVCGSREFLSIGHMSILRSLCPLSCGANCGGDDEDKLIGE
jgi:hypothetical protein